MRDRCDRRYVHCDTPGKYCHQQCRLRQDGAKSHIESDSRTWLHKKIPSSRPDRAVTTVWTSAGLCVMSDLL